MKTLLVAVCVALAGSSLAFGQAAQKPAPATQAPDALFGTWELNVAKSTITAGPQLKASTRTIEAVGAGLKFSARNVFVDGTTSTVQYTAYYDGKDYPIVGSTSSDTISMTRTDRFNSESIEKKAGKVVSRNRRVVSQDGKLYTLTAEGTDAQGKPFKNVLVFDRR